MIAFTADSDSIPGQKETLTGRRVAKVSEQLAVIEPHLSPFFCWLYLHHQLLVLYLP